MKRLFSLILSFALLLSLAAPVSAESAAGSTLRLETTEGTVTVKDASGVGKTPRSGMRLYNGYALSTAAASSAYISLDETKAVKLDASAEAEIKKQGKKLEVAVTAGQLFFNVTEPLKTDESLNIRTATMVTGIRGSFGWVNGNQMGLLHGHVTLSCINPETGETRTVDVHSGEMVSYDQASSQSAEASLQEIGFVKEAITVEAVPAIAAEEVAKDETLQAQLIEDVATISVAELVESLPEKQAAEKAAEEAALEAVLAAAEEQAQTIAEESDNDSASSQSYADLGGNTADSGDSDSSSSSDSGSSSDGGSSSGSDGNSGSGSGSPAPASSTSVSDAAGLGNALSSYNSVTFTGTGTMESLTIPVGKTLTVDEGAELTLTGNISNLSSNTFINNGTVTITGAFDNGGGVGGAAGRFVNNGTLNIRGGQFINHYNSTFTGNAPAEGSITYMYLISYEANGGSAVEAAEYTSGALVTSPAEPTKEKSVFMGWYGDANLSNSWEFTTTPVTQSVTLYAKWIPADYTVTLNTNDGTINSGDITGYSYGTGATLPRDITRTGYTFGGWYSNDQFSGASVTAIGAAETGDKTFFAKWTPETYTVTFNTGEGSTIDSQSVSYGEKASRPEKKPEKERCVFVDWYTDNTYATVFDFNSEIKANTTIYAGWGHTVTFNTGTHGSTVLSQTVREGLTATRPTTDPTRDNYMFVDWYADENCATAFNFESAITADTTVYAGWGYTVTFDTNGGSAVNSQSVVAGRTATRPTENPTKNGYTFVDWYTDSADSAMLFDFNTRIEGDTTLHAGWTVADNGSGILYVNNIIESDENDPLTLNGYLYDMPVLLTVDGQLDRPPSPKQFYSVSYDSKGNITVPTSFEPMHPQTVQSYKTLEATEGAYMLSTRDGSGKVYDFTVDSKTRFYEFEQTGDQASFRAIENVPSSLSAGTSVYLEVTDAAGSGSTTVTAVNIIVVKS